MCGVLDASRTFRRHFGSSIHRHEMGHLVCELRQACYAHRSLDAIDHFFCDVETYDKEWRNRHLSGKETELVEREQLLSAVVKYAMQ